MPYRRVKVVVTRALPEPIETRMRELFDVELNETDAPLSAEALAAAAARAEVLAPTVTDRIDDAVIARGAAAGLKLIASYGAGVDHIDVSAAKAHGVLVTNTPGVLAEDTADMTMALILAVIRRMPEGLALMQSGKWEGWAPTGMVGRRLAGKRLGIVGLGHVGRAVARRASAFGLQLHYHDRARLRVDAEEALGLTWWESLDQMLARMDVVTVHVPHTPATFHLLSARRLQLMKPTAFLINTARGEVVDETALTKMLLKGALAGAALDVFEKEPAVNPRLRGLPNVVLLPHMGSATEEGRLEMGEKVILNIKTYADGHRPPNVVTPEML
ncbi:MAG: D-glycerate dehydrogenase [Rhodobacteraceae bacterium]|nr:MAG: D-glycerate dehydrogenase [Paracoccaceae bacterium]